MPRVDVGKGKGSMVVSVLITITTDLGESYLLRDEPIVANLRTSSGKVISTSKFAWAAGMRNLKVELQVRRDLMQGDAGTELEVMTVGSTADDLSVKVQEPAVVSAWAFVAICSPDKQHQETFVRRRLRLPDGKQLTVWEETGESIARHIWYGLRRKAAVSADVWISSLMMTLGMEALLWPATYQRHIRREGPAVTHKRCRYLMRCCGVTATWVF